MFFFVVFNRTSGNRKSMVNPQKEIKGPSGPSTGFKRQSFSVVDPPKPSKGTSVKTRE